MKVKIKGTATTVQSALYTLRTLKAEITELEIEEIADESEVIHAKESSNFWEAFWNSTKDKTSPKDWITTC